MAARTKGIRMQGQTIETSTKHPPMDRFVYRMLAGIALAICVLNAGFVLNMRFQRLPNLERVVESVKLESIGRGGELLMKWNFIANAAAMLALGLSIAAFWKLGRSQIVLAYLISFIAIGTTVAAEIAITRVWTRILSRVLQ